MNTVTTINLAGAAFQIEDPGYAALKKYLDDAKAALAGNPDCDEIIGDMERAIADKCRVCLSTHKNVVSTDDAAKIVAEMGPVNAETGADGTETGSAGGAGAAGAPKPKKLYRIQEGEWIGGVATGFAAYLDIDVTLIRVLIVALTVLSSGGFALVYFVAWMVIPPAVTGAQRAQAYGAPFNAQEIVDRVKTEYARFDAKHGAEWKRHFNEWKSDLSRQHDAHKAWKRHRRQQWRQERRMHRHGPSTVGELLQLIVVVFLIWLGYEYIALVHDFLNDVWAFFNQIVSTITQAIASR